MLLPGVKADQDGRIVAFLADLVNQTLGYYTYEQEADELSTEWIDLLGVDPSALASQAVKVEAAIFKTSPVLNPGEVDPVTCAALYRNGWKDADGKPALVPIGLWTDPHHSLCYRAYNASRKIIAHSLNKHINIARPQPPGPAWADLIK